MTEDELFMAYGIHGGGQKLRSARARVMERAGPVLTCGRCGLWIDPDLPGTDPMGLSLGHVVPVKLGGSDELSNLRPEHLVCNQRAGARSWEPSPAARIAIPEVTRVR